MLVVLGILLVAFAIVWVEFPLLKNSKSNKDISLFSLFLLIGIGLNMMYELHLNPPNLLGWLMIVYKPISRIVYG